MRNLAILGSKKNGKNITLLFQMLNIKPTFTEASDESMYYYTNSHSEANICRSIKSRNDYVILTYDEFKSQYPFVLGDKVKLADEPETKGIIFDMEWSNIEETVTYGVKYGNNIDWFHKDELMYDVNNTIEYTIPNGYEFDKVENNKIHLKPIKPKYPTNYKECCNVLGLNTDIIDSELLFYYPLKCGDYTTIRLPEMEKFEKFIQLYLCKNAYWKIAGEQMGLGKPWEPNWKSGKDKYHCICTSEGEVVLGTWYVDNKILAFPTKEMRDAFYENFKDLIEQCKELL